MNKKCPGDKDRTCDESCIAYQKGIIIEVPSVYVLRFGPPIHSPGIAENRCKVYDITFKSWEFDKIEFAIKEED